MGTKSACIMVNLTIVLFALTLIPAVSAQDVVSAEALSALLPHAPSELLDDLRERGAASNFLEEGELPLLAPTENLLAEIRRDVEDLRSTVGVEIIYLLPEGYSHLSTKRMAEFLLEISDLAGVEYYSQSRNRTRPLFYESYVIESLEDDTPIDDPRIETIPSSGRMVVFQDDSTFGRNFNSIGYEVMPDTIHMVTENLSTYRWGPVAIIKPERLHLHVVLYRAENFIIYYGSFAARALRVNLFLNRIHDSFYNRLLALYDWYHDKLADSASTGYD